MFAKIGRIAWVSALSMPGEQPTVLYFFGLSDPRATAGLQRYASDWNSVQTYASESQLLGPSGPSEPSRNARKSLQTCALVVQTFGQSDKIVMLWARERAGSMEGSAFRWTDLPSRSSRIPRRKPTSIWIDFRGRRLPGGIRQRSCVRPRSRRDQCTSSAFIRPTPAECGLYLGQFPNDAIHSGTTTGPSAAQRETIRHLAEKLPLQFRT